MPLGSSSRVERPWALLPCRARCRGRAEPAGVGAPPLPRAGPIPGGGTESGRQGLRRQRPHRGAWPRALADAAAGSSGVGAEGPERAGRQREVAATTSWRPRPNGTGRRWVPLPQGQDGECAVVRSRGRRRADVIRKRVVRHRFGLERADDIPDLLCRGVSTIDGTCRGRRPLLVLHFFSLCSSVAIARWRAKC